MLLAHGSHQRSRKGEDRLRTLDTVIGGESITLILVADGHGGTLAVEHVAAHLLDRVLDAADDGSGDSMERAVTCAFRAINEEIRRLDTTSGATVMVCCINYARCELGVWNVGDTLGLLVEEHSELQLGTSHRLNDNPDELRRVAKLGVKVGRAKDAEGKAFGPLRCFPGGTTMTRTLGDTDCGEHISPEPSSRTGIPLPTAGGALVVCSDGVWDRLKVERLAKLVRMPRYSDAAHAARALVERATRHGVEDDATAVVLFFGAWQTRLSAPCRLDTKSEPAREARQHGSPSSHAPSPPQQAWSVHDGEGLSADLRTGKARESCAKRLLKASSKRKPQMGAPSVLRSWGLLGGTRLLASQRSSSEPKLHTRTAAASGGDAARSAAKDRRFSADVAATFYLHHVVDKAIALVRRGGSTAPARACALLGMANQPGRDGKAIVHVACEVGAEALLRQLLRLGASPDGAHDVDGFAPLHLAASHGHASCVRALIEAGGTVDIRDARVGATPLIVAAIHGREEAAKELLRARASIDAINDLEMTAEAYAQTYSHKGVLRVLRRYANAGARDRRVAEQRAAEPSPPAEKVVAPMSLAEQVMRRMGVVRD